MKNLTLENITKVCNGIYHGPQEKLQEEVTAITTDSRKVEKGGLFVPVVGERVDAHRFIPQVMEAGALATLSERTLEGADHPYIQVGSSLQAVKDIAEFYLEQLDIPVEIVDCPIRREVDGLALSSRNTRLTPEQRQKAPVIARTLKESITFVPEKSVREVLDYVVSTINAVPEMEVEYFEIVDGNTLESIENWSDTSYPVGCITVYCGEVRLIDNIKY